MHRNEKTTDMEFTSKKEIEVAIKKQITTSKAQAIKAMMRIYEYQTADEQANGCVTSLNGVGFAGTDAEILTAFCKQYESKQWLSDKQIDLIMKKIGKYAAQLTKHAIKNGLYVKNGKFWTVAKP